MGVGQHQLVYDSASQHLSVGGQESFLLTHSSQSRLVTAFSYLRIRFQIDLDCIINLVYATLTSIISRWSLIPQDSPKRQNRKWCKLSAIFEMFRSLSHSLTKKTWLQDEMGRALRERESFFGKGNWNRA
jgi:hypothetical protein